MSLYTQLKKSLQVAPVRSKPVKITTDVPSQEENKEITSTPTTPTTPNVKIQEKKEYHSSNIENKESPTENGVVTFIKPEEQEESTEIIIPKDEIKDIIEVEKKEEPKPSLKRPNPTKKKEPKPKKTINDFIKDSLTGQPTKFTAQKIERQKKIKEQQKLEKEKKQQDPFYKSESQEPEVEKVIMSKKEKSQTNEFEKAPQQEQVYSSAPQIQIIDGKLVLNQDSITIRQQEVNFEKDYERVDEKETKRITSATYSRFKKTPKWTKEETERFFSGIQQFGCDFSYIAKLFPNRDRRQIRNKFKKEEKENKGRIESCLRNRKAIDKQLFERMTKLGEEKKKEFEKKKQEEKKKEGKEGKEEEEKGKDEKEEKEEKDEWKSIEEEPRQVIDEGEFNEPFIFNENEQTEEQDDDDEEDFY